MAKKISNKKFRSYRRPRNQKHKNDSRPKARPPNTYEDIPLTRESLSPLRHAKRMKNLNYSKEYAFLKLKNKWKLATGIANDLIKIVWER